MNGQPPPDKPTGLLALLLEVVDGPVVVRVGNTMVSIDQISKSEGRFVLELDPTELAIAVEELVLDSVTPAKARTARPQADSPART